MVKVAAYYRVSTDGQIKDDTIETQRQWARRYATDNGLELIEFEEPTGKSGTSTTLADRPAGRELLAAASRREFTIAIAYMRNRVGRGGEATLAEKALAVFGAKFDYPQEPQNKTRMGKRMDDFQSGMYSEMVRKATMDGKATSAKQGHWTPNVAPFGYYKVTCTRGCCTGKRNPGSVLVVHGERAQIVRRIYHQYNEGIGPNQIAATLDADNVDTPGDVQETRRVNNEGWVDTSIRKILRNPAHKGEPQVTDTDPDDIEQRKPITVPVFLPDGKTVGRGIVDTATWDRAQARRKTNGPRAERRETLMMLQGKVYCTTCTAPSGKLRLLSPHGGGRTYRCASRGDKGKMSERHGGRDYEFKAKFLEGVTMAFIRRAMKDPAFLTAHTERRLAANVNALDERLNEQRDLEKKLAELTGELAEVKLLARRGKFYDSPQEAEAEIERVRADIANTNKRLAANKRDANDMELKREELIAFRDAVLTGDADGANEWTEPANAAGWRRLINIWVDRIRVIAKDNGKVDLMFDNVLAVPSLDEATQLNDVETDTSFRRRG
jgi:DNA invertase Pin-like site-specific DNA recombinase